jgi:CheY-like chemotaxis protein
MKTGQKVRILIVEDEQIVAEDLRQTLETMGYIVVGVVSRGERAVESARQEVPDLILMDIMLSGEMDGISAAQQIRSEHDIPIIYVTAYADSQLIERAKVTEPYGYIVKPFNDREVQSNIEIALFKHRLEGEIRKRDAILLALGFGVEWFLRQVYEAHGALLSGSVPKFGYNLEPILEHVGIAMELDRILVCRYTGSDGTPSLSLVAEWYGPNSSPLHAGEGIPSFSPTELGFLEKSPVVRPGECVTVSFGNLPPGSGDFLKTHGIQTIAFLPIIIRDRSWGVVAFCNKEDRDFSGEEIEAMRIMVNITSGMIGLSLVPGIGVQG